MMAELHLMDGMEESLRQLTDVERSRAVSMAQQESVSLAQILKVRGWVDRIRNVSVVQKLRVRGWVD